MVGTCQTVHCPPYLGDGGSWDLHKFEVFWGGVWVRGMKSVKLTSSVLSVLFNRCSTVLGKCVHQLQIVRVICGFWGQSPRPPPELCSWTLLGDFGPRPSVSTPPPNTS